MSNDGQPISEFLRFPVMCLFWGDTDESQAAGAERFSLVTVETDGDHGKTVTCIPLFTDEQVLEHFLDTSFDLTQSETVTAMALPTPAHLIKALEGLHGDVQHVIFDPSDETDSVLCVIKNLVAAIATDPLRN